MRRHTSSRLSVEVLDERVVPTVVLPQRMYTPDPFFSPVKVGETVSYIESVTDNVQDILPLPDGGALVLTLASGFVPDSQPILTRVDVTGQIVTSFGDNGRAIVPINAVYAQQGARMALDSQGRILVAATRREYELDSYTIQVARITATGQADPTFGTDGVQTTVSGTVGDIVVAPNGTILIGGTRQPRNVDEGPSFLVERLNPDGSFDTTFDGDGIMTIPFDPTIGQDYSLQDLELTPQGIVLAGASAYIATGSSVTVVRLNNDGSFDETFAHGGLGSFDFGVDYQLYSGLEVRPDGRILIGGTRRYNPADERTPLTAVPTFTLLQLTASGVPDLTFGTHDGMADLRWFDLNNFTQPSYADFALDSGGRIIIVTGQQGESRPALIASLESNGASIGSGLTELELPAGSQFTLPRIALDSHNRLYLAAYGAGTSTGEYQYSAPLMLHRFALVTGQFTTDVAMSTGTEVTLINGDIVGEWLIATASAPGEPALVTLDRGMNAGPKTTFSPFESSFLGGVYVNAADVNGDGQADLIVTAGNGGGPVVAIYDGAKLADGQLGEDALLVRFLGIPDPNFRGGCQVTGGDVTGDGIDDLVIAAGIGGGPRVTTWDGASLRAESPRVMADFFAFEPSIRFGAVVAVGDVNEDKVADVIFGAGVGGSPRVREFDGKILFASGTSIGSLDDAPPEAKRRDEFVGDPNDRGGVQVTYRPPSSFTDPEM